MRVPACLQRITIAARARAIGAVEELRVDDTAAGAVAIPRCLQRIDDVDGAERAVRKNVGCVRAVDAAVERQAFDRRDAVPEREPAIADRTVSGDLVRHELGNGDEAAGGERGHVGLARRAVGRTAVRYDRDDRPR